MYGRYRKYRDTVLVSYNTADAIDALLYSGYLTTDVEAAARCAPLQFHRQQDSVLFEREAWWHARHEILQDAAQRVLRKFDGWYQKATPVQKAYLVLPGLMYTHEVVEQLIDKMVDDLGERHSCQFIDSDDSISLIDDYHAIRDPANIAAVLDLPANQIAGRLLEKQAQRMVMAPIVQVEAIQAWDRGIREFQTEVYDYHFNDVFARTGISPKRARKVIARSYELLQRFVGRQQALQMIHGEELRIRANHLIWGLQMNPGKIISGTIDPSGVHTPFVITIYDHDSNKLGKGCVLWPGTPVLDQAVAFILATADPDEELELLNQMNVSQITEIGRTSAVLQSKIHDGDRYIFERPVIDLREEAANIEVVEVTNYVEEVTTEVVDVPVELLGEIQEQETPRTHLFNLDDGTEPVALDDPNFDARYYASISTRKMRRRDQRLQNDLVQKVQQMFFARIDAPPNLLNLMNTPTHLYWDHRDMVKSLPPTTLRYLATKQID